MSLPKYPEYKDSKVEWLGAVPSHWHVDRIKASIDSSRNGIWGDEPQGDESDIACVRVADFDRTKLLVKEQIPTLRSVTEKEREGRILSRGNLLLEKSGGGELQPVGQVVMYHLDEPAVCSNFVAKVALKSGMVPSFWKYAHSAAYAVGVNIGSINQTSGIQNLDQDRYFNERAPYPPEYEQTAIATFLDHETGKIDTLIAEQEKLLTLLAEKRQATISHAVTKGLNPDAPMKDSGVAWLGDVPAHWEVRRLKGISPQITVGIVVEPSKYYCDEGVPALRSLNVEPGRVKTENLVFISAEANEQLQKSRLAAGDLVAVRSGQVGTTAVIPSELDGCNCIDLIIIRKPQRDSELFLCWFLGSGPAQQQFAEGAGGAIQQHFNIGMAMNLVVPRPPVDEQIQISKFLLAESERLDDLTAETTRAIALLKERRSALIAAAVTGQIDVRNEVLEEKAA